MWATPVVRAAGTSGLAVAAIILGLLGFTVIGAILAIILGIVALRRIRRTAEGGKGLAIAAIVLGVLWMVPIGGVAALKTAGASGTSSPSPEISGRSSGLTVSVFSLAAGDCFDNPTSTADQNVNTVLETSCTARHNAQIFATFKVKGSLLNYPSNMKQLAESGCNARIKGSLDTARVTDSMSVRFLVPLETSWLAGRRTVSCMIVSPATLTQSVVR